MSPMTTRLVITIFKGNEQHSLKGKDIFVDINLPKGTVSFSIHQGNEDVRLLRLQPYRYYFSQIE